VLFLHFKLPIHSILFQYLEKLRSPVILCSKVSRSLDLQGSDTDTAPGHFCASAYSLCVQTVRELPLFRTKWKVSLFLL